MENYTVLDQVNSPEDLRHLGSMQLNLLCKEIRDFLIRTVSGTGGHLASNLGAVELTVALHKIFHSPQDQIVWDVGHQSYTHKILTGRKNAMSTLRQQGGVSGFTKTKESIHDSFISGHSSTSIAVAGGLAKAKQIKREQGHVVGVLGDGAFTGGMTLEGLNNASRGGKNLIIILNDNHMSISKNVGRLSHYLSKLRANKRYFKLKDIAKSAIGAVPLVGDRLVETVTNSKAQLKNVVYNTSFFEEMGFIHMGPVDGHDLSMLCDVLGRAKTLGKPVFIHVETQKGKGYPPAERNPGAYHGVPPFDPGSGVDPMPAQDCFSTVFGRHLVRIAEEDNRVCAITAAMKYATGLNYFSKRFKSQGRFHDVGIAEQYGVTFGAALAAKGLIPVFAVYSSFLQRGYDQILHDCSIEKRHVVLAVDRAGLVGEDGETHQGLFDCAFLTTIPGISIYSPATYHALRYSIGQAIGMEDGVCAVRYPRGAQPRLPGGFAEDAKGDFGLNTWGEQRDLLVISYGREYTQAAAAVKRLRQSNVAADALCLTKIWPFNPETLEIAKQYRRILFVEEGMRHGGIGGHFLAALHNAGYRGDYFHKAVDGFVEQGTVSQQLEWLGLDCNGILECILQNLSERKQS